MQVARISEVAEMRKKISPMTYRKIQCLFCNRITFGSGFDTEYCHVCYHKYIKQLEAKKKRLKEALGHVCSRCQHLECIVALKEK